MMQEWMHWVFFGVIAFMLWRKLAGKSDPATAKQLVQDGALLLDVRSPGEFSGGHIPGAQNIPVHELAGRVAELGADKARPVVVYCASGMRSASAAGTLRKAGFARVEDLGGMMRWPR
jgi:phage shock protein E